MRQMRRVFYLSVADARGCRMLIGKKSDKIIAGTPYRIIFVSETTKTGTTIEDRKLKIEEPD